MAMPWSGARWPVERSCGRSWPQSPSGQLTRRNACLWYEALFAFGERYMPAEPRPGAALMLSHRLCRSRARCNRICATFSRLSASLVPPGNSNTSVASNGLITCTAGFSAPGPMGELLMATAAAATAVAGGRGCRGCMANCAELHQAKAMNAMVGGAILATEVRCQCRIRVAGPSPGRCCGRKPGAVRPGATDSAGPEYRDSPSNCSGVTSMSIVSSPSGDEVALRSSTGHVPPPLHSR